jgi:hypothetical protein
MAIGELARTTRLLPLKSRTGCCLLLTRVILLPSFRSALGAESAWLEFSYLSPSVFSPRWSGARTVEIGRSESDEFCCYITESAQFPGAEIRRVVHTLGPLVLPMAATQTPAVTVHLASLTPIKRSVQILLACRENRDSRES